MHQLLYSLPNDILASVYGCGNYSGQSYNNSCSPAPTPSPKSSSSSSSGSSSGTNSNTNNSAATGAITLQVLSVDRGTPYISSSATETVSTFPTISGTAPPGSKVVITIHSQPVTCTTTANTQGNWSCTFSTQIALGLHTVYVVATTPQGQVLNFPAFHVKAVKTVASTTTQPVTTNSNHGLSGTAWAGIIAAGIIVLILVAWLIIALVKRRKHQQPPQGSGPTVTPTSPPPPAAG